MVTHVSAVAAVQEQLLPAATLNEPVPPDAGKVLSIGLIVTVQFGVGVGPGVPDGVGVGVGPGVPDGVGVGVPVASCLTLCVAPGRLIIAVRATVAVFAATV